MIMQSMCLFASMHTLKWQILGVHIFQMPECTGPSLEGQILEGPTLEGQILTYAHLDGAYLRGAILAGADMHGALVDDANLQGADLSLVQSG